VPGEHGVQFTELKKEANPALQVQLYSAAAPAPHHDLFGQDTHASAVVAALTVE
jgi:hypothetical protein